MNKCGRWTNFPSFHGTVRTVSDRLAYYTTVLNYMLWIPLREPTHFQGKNQKWNQSITERLNVSPDVPSPWGIVSLSQCMPHFCHQAKLGQISGVWGENTHNSPSRPNRKPGQGSSIPKERGNRKSLDCKMGSRIKGEAHITLPFISRHSCSRQIFLWLLNGGWVSTDTRQSLWILYLYFLFFTFQVVTRGKR